MKTKLPLGSQIKELRQRINQINKTVESYIENYVTALEVKAEYNCNYGWLDITLPTINRLVTIYPYTTVTDFKLTQKCPIGELSVDEYRKLLEDKKNANRAVVQAILAFKYITD